MPNIITAVFGGNSRYCTTRPVFQVDRGDVLKFVGLDLPEYYEVHFSNSKNALAKRVLASGDSVVIPWEYMKHGQKEVFAWVYLTPDAETGYTPYQVTIPLNLRSDISESQPTPAQEDIVDEAISALNEGVERAENAADKAEEATEHYPRIVNGYWQVWDAEAQTWVDTGVKAVGEDGAPGQPGRDGQDGAPGVTYTPTVSADGEISWTNDGGLPNPQPRNIMGPQGQDGAPGQPGRDGATGPAGKSAYASAVDGGYSGTEAQFNEDLSSVGDKYEKPSSGIPSSDMSNAVQTSLGKADTALQEHQSLAAYRAAADQDVIDAGKAASASVPNAGSVSSAGVISIKHDNTELFTVQLPLYTGGVSSGT